MRRLKHKLGNDDPTYCKNKYTNTHILYRTIALHFATFHSVTFHHLKIHNIKTLHNITYHYIYSHPFHSIALCCVELHYSTLNRFDHNIT